LICLFIACFQVRIYQPDHLSATAVNVFKILYTVDYYCWYEEMVTNTLS